MFRKSALLIIPVGLLFNNSVASVACVFGISMQPALNPDILETGHHDWILLNRFKARSYQFERGDVVVLRSPVNASTPVVKRIVALQGDLVRTQGYKHELVTVPQGHCWVEGDHSMHSQDSNSYGPVALGLITAKVTHVIWPPARWRKVESFIPEGRYPIISL